MQSYVLILLGVLVILLIGIVYFGWRKITNLEIELSRNKYDIEALRNLISKMLDSNDESEENTFFNKTQLSNQYNPVNVEMNQKMTESLPVNNLNLESYNENQVPQNSPNVEVSTLNSSEETDDSTVTIESIETSDNENEDPVLTSEQELLKEQEQENEENQESEEEESEDEQETEDNNETEEYQETDEEEQLKGEETVEEDDEEEEDEKEVLKEKTEEDEKEESEEEEKESEDEEDNLGKTKLNIKKEIKNLKEKEKDILKEVKVVEETGRKKKKNVPNKSARSYKEGYTAVSENDGKTYMVFGGSNGVKRWKLLN